MANVDLCVEHPRSFNSHPWKVFKSIETPRYARGFGRNLLD